MHDEERSEKPIEAFFQGAPHVETEILFSKTAPSLRENERFGEAVECSTCSVRGM